MDEIDMNKCPHCNTSNVAEAEFCKKCGTSLGEGEIKLNNNPGKVAFLILIPIALLAFFLVINGVFPLTEDAKDEKIASTYHHKGYGEASILINKYYKNNESKRQYWVTALKSKSENNNSLDIPEPKMDKPSVLDLKIQDGWSWTAESNYSYIRGRVTNDGDKNINYFKITAEYMDSNGNVVDTDFTNSGDTIRPGNSKEFEIMHRHSPDYHEARIFVDEVN